MSLLSLRQRMILDLPMRIGDHRPGDGLTRNRGRGGAALDGVFGAGGATPTKLAYRRGYYFDGGDYLSIADDALLRFDGASQNFTLLACFAADAADNDDCLIDKRDADDDGWRLGFAAGGVIEAAVNTVDITGSTAVVGLGLHTAVFSAHRDGLGELYLDGILDGSADISGQTLATTVDAYLGRIAYPAGGYFEGNLYHAGGCDIAFSALDAAEYHYWYSRLCGRARETA